MCYKKETCPVYLERGGDGSSPCEACEYITKARRTAYRCKILLIASLGLFTIITFSIY